MPSSDAVNPWGAIDVEFKYQEVVDKKVQLTVDRPTSTSQHPVNLLWEQCSTFDKLDKDLSIKEFCDMWHQRRSIKLTSVVYGVNQTVRTVKTRQDWQEDEEMPKVCMLCACLLEDACRGQNSSAVIENVSSITGWRDCAVGNGSLYLSDCGSDVRGSSCGIVGCLRSPPVSRKFSANFTSLQ